ncbi:LLM class flavin-dependent oxidoreductase [Amycolatopsis sp. FDAARGOS 1241]|uniref:LLM class flavin-dependent oxidoreductase n=1 Tax=Amycolatopsis sp. FDAARGOS 1241 TaxID=2778070 RepID=UPI001951B5AC|nr:LLM class flavin-dependent oxidoreductase [Amycolatopsis sp. FDAARGOS 1241]QRP49746.1 LLM class flavin-dependent oxidoreductase [Amycolatopsis sp. FDAARGOS 1241]
MTAGPHLAIALEGAGWHPAAWREPAARPAELLTAGYWSGLVQEAEAAKLDFVTFEDFLSLRTGARGPFEDRTDVVQGRLDAVLIASRVAPLTSRIGLVPTAVVTHTEPFHLSKAIATLDYVSGGRAGVRVQVSRHEEEYANFGRRSPGPAEDLFDEAADYVEVLRRLWDSWEDDAEIRDVATGRFVDRDKLHYIDFEGRWFSVKGPSITPRPPQGQPLVAALAHNDVAYRLAERAADLVYVTPRDRSQAGDIVGALDDRLKVFADLVVFLDDKPGAAAGRKAHLDDLAGAEYTSDAHVFTGTPAELADLLLDWHAAGLTGFRLRPGSIPGDLTAITRGLVPELRERGGFRHDYDAATLRGRFGLPRPANRYAA